MRSRRNVLPLTLTIVLVLVAAVILLYPQRADANQVIQTTCADSAWFPWTNAVTGVMGASVRTQSRIRASADGPPCPLEVVTETTTNGTVTTETSPLPAAPQQLPTRLLQPADLIHQGSFKIPDMVDATGLDCAWTMGRLAFNPAGDAGKGSLFIVCHDWQQQVAEISLAVAGGTARQLQAPRDATEGRLALITPVVGSNNKIGGMHVVGNQLILSAYVYYDGAGEARSSHFVRSTNLSQASVRGPFRVGTTGYAGTNGGYFAPVPPEWRTAIGASLLNGQCCRAIAGMWSHGPAASGVNEADLLAVLDPSPAKQLIYYPMANAPAAWCNVPPSPFYNGTSEPNGLLFPAGTASILFLGRHGLGPCIYTGGPNAPPYQPQVWAYNAHDVRAVIAGTKQTWEIMPYAIFRLPGLQSENIGGAAVDQATGLIYVSENMADGAKPIIHKFAIAGSITPPPPPAQEICGDKIDNDGDGLVDEGCATTPQDTTPPTGVSLTVTPTTITLGQTAQLTATATDNVGIASVTFLVEGTVTIGTDTSAPYEASFTPDGSGPRQLTAVARDAAGNPTTSAPVAFQINPAGTPPPPPPPDTTPPAVTITVPSPTVLVGQAQTLTATATDASGITRVEFYANTTLIGTDVSAPYAVPWTPTAVAVVAVRAEALDTAGIRGTSPSVTVTVSAPPVPPPPPPPTTTPITSLTALAPTHCTLVASVTGVTMPATFTGSSRGIRIQRSSDNATWVNHGSRDTSGPSYEAREYVPNRTWFFRYFWQSSTTSLPPVPMGQKNGCGQ